MTQLVWFDFTTHNNATGEQVRAFSINHPQAGRLVVFKGVKPFYSAALQDLGMSKTPDGAWVVRARDLKPALLQERVFPRLALARVQLSDIDLTDQYLTASNANRDTQKPVERDAHPALLWLSLNSRQSNEIEGLRQYQGPLPSSVASALWDHLDQSVPGIVQPNGQTLYKGTVSGSYFLLVRSQKLLGAPERVRFFEAKNQRQLPIHAVTSQAPALFRASDVTAEQLQELGEYYTASNTESASTRHWFTPSRKLADIQTKAMVARDQLDAGYLVTAKLKVKRPFSLAVKDFDTTVTVSSLLEIAQVEDRVALFANLPESAWVKEPVDINAIEASPTATLHADVLSGSPSFRSFVESRGFDSIVFYREDPNTRNLGIDAFTDDAGVTMVVSPLSDDTIEVVQVTVREGVHTVPKGYDVVYGQGVRDGYIGLVFSATGRRVTHNGQAWFTKIADAVEAIKAVNAYSHTPALPENLESAVIEAFSEPPEQTEHDTTSISSADRNVNNELEHRTESSAIDLDKYPTARQLIADLERTKQEQSHRQHLLGDTDALRAYAKEQGMYEADMRALLQYNFNINRELLVQLEKAASSDDVQQRLREEKERASTIKFTSSSNAVAAQMSPTTGLPFSEAFEHNGVKIYPRRITADDSRWCVQIDDNRGTDRTFGDEIFESREAAIEHVDEQTWRKEENRKYHEKVRQREAIEQARRNQEQREYADLDGFGDGKSSMALARIQKILNQNVRHKGVVKSRKQLIRDLVAAGYTVETEKRIDDKAKNNALEEVKLLRRNAPIFNDSHPQTQKLRDIQRRLANNDFNVSVRILNNSEGHYYEASDITKTAIDYAEHLLNHRNVSLQIETHDSPTIERAVRDAEERFALARALSEEYRQALGNKTLVKSITKRLKALAKKTPADEDKTVYAIGLLATRLGLNADPLRDDLEFASPMNKGEIAGDDEETTTESQQVAEDDPVNSLNIQIVPDNDYSDTVDSKKLQAITDGIEVGNLTYNVDPNGVFTNELSNVFGSELYINNVAVQRAYRRQGIGTKLIQGAIDIAQTAGIEVVTLYRTPDGVPDAKLKAFYESLGFISEWEGLNSTNPTAMLLPLKSKHTFKQSATVATAEHIPQPRLRSQGGNSPQYISYRDWLMQEALDGNLRADRSGINQIIQFDERLDEEETDILIELRSNLLKIQNNEDIHISVQTSIDGVIAEFTKSNDSDKPYVATWKDRSGRLVAIAMDYQDTVEFLGTGKLDHEALLEQEIANTVEPETVVLKTNKNVIREAALDALAGAKNFEDAGISLGKDGRFTTVIYESETLAYIEGDVNRQQVQRALFKAMDALYEMTPNLYAHISEDIQLQEMYQEILDPLFVDRLVTVRNLLREQGWTGDSNSPMTSPEGIQAAHVVNHVGAGRNVVGLRYRVGDYELEDDLRLSPEDICQKLITACNTLLKQHESEPTETKPAPEALAERQTIDATKNVTSGSLRNALLEGQVIVTEQGRYWLEEADNSMGWVACSNTGRATVRQGGDPRGGGFTREEAMKKLWEDIETQIPVIEDEVQVHNQPPQDTPVIQNEREATIRQLMEIQHTHFSGNQNTVPNESQEYLSDDTPINEKADELRAAIKSSPDHQTFLDSLPNADEIGLNGRDINPVSIRLRNWKTIRKKSREEQLLVLDKELKAAQSDLNDSIERYTALKETGIYAISDYDMGETTESAFSALRDSASLRRNHVSWAVSHLEGLRYWQAALNGEDIEKSTQKAYLAEHRRYKSREDCNTRARVLSRTIREFEAGQAVYIPPLEWPESSVQSFSENQTFVDISTANGITFGVTGIAYHGEFTYLNADTLALSDVFPLKVSTLDEIHEEWDFHSRARGDKSGVKAKYGSKSYVVTGRLKIYGHPREYYREALKHLTTLYPDTVIADEPNITDSIKPDFADWTQARFDRTERQIQNKRATAEPDLFDDPIPTAQTLDNLPSQELFEFARAMDNQWAFEYLKWLMAQRNDYDPADIEDLMVSIAHRSMPDDRDAYRYIQKHRHVVGIDELTDGIRSGLVQEIITSDGSYEVSLDPTNGVGYRIEKDGTHLFTIFGKDALGNLLLRELKGKLGPTRALSPTLRSEPDVTTTTGDRNSSSQSLVPDAPPVTLKPGPRDQFFLITGPGLEQISHHLEDLKGIYIKKYQGYRFKKAEEHRVRNHLLMRADSGQITIDDQIRTPIELSVGIRFLHKGVEHEVTGIHFNRQISPSKELEIVVTTGKDTSVTTHGYYSVSGFQKRYELRVTNVEELGEQLEQRSKSEAEFAQAVRENHELQDAYIRATDNDGVDPITGRSKDDLTSDIDHRTQHIEQLRERNTNDNAATPPTLSVIPGKPAPGVATSQFANKGEQDANSRYRVFRGQVATRIGRNRDGSDLFTFDSGLRLLLESGDNLKDEEPYVNEEGGFQPPASRRTEFKLLSELAVHSKADNVLELHPGEIEEPEPDLSKEEVEALYAERGIDLDQLAELVRLDHQLRDSDGKNEFVINRLRKDYNKALTTLQQFVARAGYEVSEQSLRELGDRAFKQHSDTAEKITSHLIAIAIQKEIRQRSYISDDDAASLNPESAKMLPPSWLNQKLEDLKNTTKYAAYCLVVAKVYGAKADIQTAERVFESDNTDSAKALTDEFDQRFGRIRAYVEIPALILELEEQIKNHTGRSSIAVDNKKRKIQDWHDKLARFQYNIDSIEIGNEDLATYHELGSVTEIDDHYSVKHGLSIYAARLYRKRVSEHRNMLAHQAFIESDEFQAGIEAARLVQEQLPEGVVVESGETYNSWAMEFPWGGGFINVSRPELENQQYKVWFSYNAGSRQGSFEPSYSTSGTHLYPELPSARQMAEDTLSFAAIHQTDVLAYKAPAYGTWFKSLGDEKYRAPAIAKRLRETIKQSINNGDLPQGLKTSVRSDYNSITLIVKALPSGFELYSPEYITWHREQAKTSWPLDQSRPATYSREGNALVTALKRYLDAWNYNQSDTMQDSYNYNYFASFNIDYELEKEFLAAPVDVEARRAEDQALYKQLADSSERDLAARFKTFGFIYSEDGRNRVGLNLNHRRQIQLMTTAGEDITPSPLDGQREPTLTQLGVASVYWLNRSVPAPSIDFEPITTTSATTPEALIAAVRRLTESWGLSEAINAGEYAVVRAKGPEATAPQISLTLDGGVLTLNNDAEDILVLDTGNDWQILVSPTGENPIAILQDFADRYLISSVENKPIALDGANGAVEVEYLSTLSMDERTHQIYNACSLDVTPTPIPLLPSAGVHRMAGIQDTHGASAWLGTTLASSGHTGIIIIANGYPNKNEAFSAVLEAFEHYAMSALEQGSAIATVEAMAIIQRLEYAIGGVAYEQSELITTEQRAIVNRGGTALQTYYMQLVNQGAVPDKEAFIYTRTIELPSQNGELAQLHIGRTGNDVFVFGAQIPMDGTELKVPFSPENTPYPDSVSAVVAFLRMTQRYRQQYPALTQSCIEAIQPHLPDGTAPLGELLTVAESENITTQQQAQAALDLVGTNETFKVANQEDGNHILVAKDTPADHHFSVTSYRKNTNQPPVYILQLPEHSTDIDKATLIDQARLAGGQHNERTEHTQEGIFFPSISAVEEFTRANGYQYELTEIVDQRHTLDTNIRRDNIPTSLAQALHNEGFIRSDLPNVWVIGTTAKDSSVSIAFHPGLDGSTLDANVSFRGRWRMIKTSFTGWNSDISIHQIVHHIDTFLNNHQLGNLALPVPEPAISRIRGEQACQILLGAGINITHHTEANSFEVTGETFWYRNTLTHLGGTFSSNKKPTYSFSSNPTKRLAAAIAGSVKNHSETVLIEGPYRFTIEPTDGGFNVLMSRQDSEQRVIIHTTNSLYSARLELIKANLDNLDTLWHRTIGGGSHEQHPTASVANTLRHDTAGRDSDQQPDLVSRTEPGEAAGLAGSSREPDQPESRSTRKPDDDILNKLSGESDAASTSEENDRGGSQSDDGHTLGASRERELFNLKAVRATEDKSREGIGARTLNALKTLLDLRNNKSTPTAKQRQALAQFVGLGSKLFTGSREDNVFSGYKQYTINAEIRQTLRRFSQEDRASLTETTLSGFFTSDDIVDFMWNALRRLGVNEHLRQLDLVEPAAGSGHFIGGAPDYVRQGASILAIEKDKVTSEIATHLYPEARVLNKAFEKVLLPPNSKDLFVGNPPYSDVHTYNPNTGKREVIHDLLLRESINAVRPGGIVSFVTSSGTLDKKSTALRDYIYLKADLLKAIRLPTSAFGEAGTEVVTDIVFFRARLPGEPAGDNSWISTEIQTFESNDSDIELRINRYFIDNPENVLGEQGVTSSQFGPKLTCRDNGRPLTEQLIEQLPSFPVNVFSPQRARVPLEERIEEHDLDEDTATKNRVGSLIVVGGDIHRIGYNRSEAKYFSTPAKVLSGQVGMVKHYILLRDAAKTLLSAENEPPDAMREKFIDRQRIRLNSLYEDFVTRYGPIGDRKNRRYFRADPDVYFVSQLECYDRKTNTATKADIFSRRVVSTPTPESNIKTPLDALYASMSRFGHVDPHFCTSLLNRPWEDIEMELGEAVFFDPEAGHYTTASTYLSGDVIAKHEAAQRALVLQPNLEKNIKALEAVRPKPIPYTDIRIKLGSPWIPIELVTDFARYILHVKFNEHEKCWVKYEEKLGAWQIHATNKVLDNARKQNTFEYGTEDVYFIALLKHCLEQTKPTVYKTRKNGTQVIAHNATQKARFKQSKIEDRFRQWIYESPERCTQCEAAYNYTVNRFVPPDPDGRYLLFPGLASELKGQPFTHHNHQQGVIERGLTSLYGLLIGHEAGAGKTISMVCLAIKSNQLGIHTKPLMVVPNHMLVQFTNEALEIYPNARILAVSKEDLNPQGRESFANKVRLNNWDIIICTHEQFKAMRMPLEYVEQLITNEIAEYEELLTEAKGGGDRFTVKHLTRVKKKLEEQLKKELSNADKHKDAIDFTELGIDAIYYDEAHGLKNRAFPTKNSSLAGVNSSTSQKALDAEMKFDWIRKKRGDGKGIILATGTPISNTIGEIFVFMRYLAPDLLDRAGIRHFDAFVATFGEPREHIEIKVDGSGYQVKERLSRFHNAPELLRLFSTVTDIKTGDALKLKRPTAHNITRVSEQTPEQKLFMSWLSCRATRVKEGEVELYEDNMLNIFHDLQIMSVDQRLFHPDLPNHPESKVNLELMDILRSWKEHSEDRRTQLIFCDFGVPNTKNLYDKGKFCLYIYCKNWLINQGIPAEEIAFIHDAKTDQDKEELFKAMREGTIRICFASTVKMGVGTNVQTRGSDLRHLSYPLRSIDIEQRNKRFERQGCLFDDIYIHYPTTKDSGDLAVLQMLDRKHKMTQQIMRCDFENMARSIDEEFEPTYEDLMAITTGNEVIKKKLEIDKLVEDLRQADAIHLSNQNRARYDAMQLKTFELPSLKSQLEATRELAQRLLPMESFEMTINGIVCRKAKDAGAEAHRAANKMSAYTSEMVIGEFRGLPLLITLKDTTHYLTLDAPKRISVALSDNLAHFPGQLSRVVKDRVEQIDRIQQRIAETEAEITDYEEVAQSPFPQEEALQQALERQSELNVELRELEKERPQKTWNGLHPFEELIQRLNSKGTRGNPESDIAKALEADDATKQAKATKGNVLTECDIAAALEADDDKKIHPSKEKNTNIESVR